MTISVIIPCYNAEHYLEQAIGSVLCQSMPASEIIVVDDGSTDNSLSVARQFGEEVTIIQQPNGGGSVARNRGAEIASGDALLFLDADDVLGPDVLEALSSALYREPDTIAVGPWYCLRQIDGQWVRTRRNSPPRRHGYDDLANWLSGWFHATSSVLWSRKAFAEAGGWDQRAYVMDDGELVMRAMAKGCTLSKATYGASYYRRLPEDTESVSDTRHSREGIRSRLYAISKLATLIEKEGKAPRYAHAIGEAFDNIALDCSHHPDLFEECQEAARNFAGADWYRSLRQEMSKLAAKFSRTWRRHIPIVKSIQIATEPPEEVRAGLDWRDRVTTQPDITASTSPVISVVLPTYNRSLPLKRALESVLAQTFDNFELLVVDDASTDDTQKVVADMQDVRIRYLRQETNRGVSAARNRGLREARGDFVAFLDSDDEWLPEKLDLQMRRFEEVPETVGLLYTGVETILDGGQTSIREPSCRGDVFDEMLLVNRVYTTSGVMIRRSAAEQIGFFDERTPANEDWDYWLRLSRYYKVDYVESVLMRYSAVSASDRKSMAFKDDIDARDRFYEKNAEDMRRAGLAPEFLQESIRRHLIPECWYPARARTLIAEAFRLEPFAPRTWLLFTRSMLPYGAYTRMRRAWRGVLSWLEERRRGEEESSARKDLQAT